MERRRHERSIILGGQRVDLLTRDDLGTVFDAAVAGTRPPLRLASANLDHVYRFEGEDGLFEPSSEGQWLVLLDGMPLVWETRRRTGHSWEKLAGSDVLPELLTRCEQQETRVGFLGGTDQMRAALPAALGARWPDLQVAGHWTPPREVVEDESASGSLATAIADAGVDFLVVGLGKPRQERWICRHGGTTKARVCAAFGASAEFIAGTQQRAPEAFSRIGAEWAYRLAREPRRMARRYLAEGPVALARVLTAS